MTVKIITDSLSDITGPLIDELGISVVPVYVRFGEEIYKDRVEITTEEFYRRLVSSDMLPTTTQPTPNDFAEAYEAAAKDADELLVVTLSSNLSGTYQSAMHARDMVASDKLRIEVIDSRILVMALGLVIISAANAVKQGAGLDEAAALVRSEIQRSNVFMAFDTLKYLVKGGRIGKAQGFVGSLLSVTPILTVKDGVIHPGTRVRTVQAGMDYFCNYVAKIPKIEGLAVEHATTPELADKLTDRLGEFYPREKIVRSTVSPVIGTYAGPHVLSISVLAAA